MMTKTVLAMALIGWLSTPVGAAEIVDDLAWEQLSTREQQVLRRFQDNWEALPP